jgi:hypothetical protein
MTTSCASDTVESFLTSLQDHETLTVVLMDQDAAAAGNVIEQLRGVGVRAAARTVEASKPSKAIRERK